MMLLEKINSMGTTVVVVTHAREIVDEFSKRVVAIDGGMIISDRTGGYYVRPDVTRLTEEAAQRAAASARRRQVLAEELGIAVEEEEAAQEEVLSQAEGPGEEAPPEPPAREPDFSFEELDLHLGEGEPDLRDEMYDDASLHNENGAWQMIFGLDTIPAYRCRGCAGMLLQHAIDESRAQGRRGLVLTCKDHLVHYYARFGFVNEGFTGSTHGGVNWNQMRLTF